MGRSEGPKRAVRVFYILHSLERTRGNWHAREVEQGPCASARFRLPLGGFDVLTFMVRLNHNEAYTGVRKAGLRIPTLVPHIYWVLSSQSHLDLACTVDVVCQRERSRLDHTTYGLLCTHGRVTTSDKSFIL